MSESTRKLCRERCIIISIKPSAVARFKLEVEPRAAVFSLFGLASKKALE